MELPNYFLADLPDASTLTPKLVTDACHTLKQNREKFLSTQSTGNLIAILAKLALEWLDPEFPFRKLTLEEGPARTGFSRGTLASGLDRFFSQVTVENLKALVLQDLGSLHRLDEPAADETERRTDRSSIARGPNLLTHITAGVIPNPTLTSMMLGLLCKSAQFFKCGTGTSYLPRMFAHSLYFAHPKLGACLEIAEWPGGTNPLEDALFAETDLLTATGSDKTLNEIRHRLPPPVRFLGYGHKVSFAYVSRESLEKTTTLIPALANDITAWDQLGCLSPHTIYLETDAPVPPEKFCDLLATELAAREQLEPRGTISAESAAAIRTRRLFYEVRASTDPATKIWSSDQSTAWTVVLDSSIEFQPSCLNRFILVKPVGDFEDLAKVLEPIRGQISTVGLAAPMARAQKLALRFARSGATRICRAGEMQNPPLAWRHDGRPSLGDLVTWTDIEFSK